MGDEQPWAPRIATERIRAMARHEKFGLAYKLHARDQMFDRSIVVSDILFVLKFGFVFLESTPATRPGFFRYAMENKTPNSDSRDIRVIVIPDQKRCLLKLITVMWVDELATRAGSIISE